MAAISWIKALGGDWAVGPNWSGGVSPAFGDDVTIAQASTAAITITTTVFANSLTLGTAQTTVTDTGSLFLTGLLNVGPGAFNIGSNGSVVGGTIADPSGRLALLGGTATFDGVAYQGVLNLPMQNTTANFVDGVAFSGVGGAGRATINMTGVGTLQGTGVETFDNATLNLGGLHQNGVSELYANDSAAKGGGVLTLGANFTVQQGADRALIGSSGGVADGVINKGVINAAGGQSMAIASTFFTNQGAVNASGGEMVDLSAVTFTNAASGQVNVTGGATLSIDGTGGWSNAGVINESAATLNLGGKFSTANLGSITRSGGVVDIAGVLDNTGATVSFGSGPAANIAGPVVLSGTIKNGLIQSTVGGLTGAGVGTLDGVALQGVLDLSSTQSTLTVINGIGLAGAGGVGAATINLTGSSAVLNTKGNETLDNATLNIGASGSNAVLNAYDPYGAGTITTLGGQFVIQHAGLLGTLDGTDVGNNGFLNNGTINAGFSGGHLTLMNQQSGGLTGGLFTNAGAIAASNSDTVEIGASTFTNSGTLTATSGATVTIDGTKGWTNAGQISETGATLNLGGKFATSALAGINRSGGVINLTGTEDNSGATVLFGAGSAIGAVNLKGTIKNGVVANAAGGLVAAGGVLDGVTYQGGLDLTNANAQLTITNGVTLSGVGGVGASVINVTGANTALLTNGSETLDHAVINLGSAGGGPGQIFLQDFKANGASLTLGPAVTIQQSGISAQIESSDQIGDVVTNRGTINAGVAGGTFTIGIRQGVPGGTFVNAGTIAVTNTDIVDIGQKTFQNTGSITVASGASLYIDGLGSWSNSGTITDNGGSVIIASAFTTASLAGVSRTGGTVTLSGALDNTGATLNVGPGTSLGALVFKGSVTGGIIADSGGGLAPSYATLSGVTYQGVLDLSAYGDFLTISNGIAFAGAGGVGQGLVKLTGYVSALDVKGNATLDNAVVDIGAANNAVLSNDDGSAPGGSTLTLGPNLDIVQTGAYATLTGASTAGDSIINNGVITAALAGGNFVITPLKFTNVGTLIAGAGETLDLRGAHLTNLNGATLTGGLYQASGGGFIQLIDNSLVTTLQADVTETGATAAVRSLVTATSVQRNLDSTLTSIGSSGALRLMGGRSITTGGAFSIGGMLQLGGGTFTCSALSETSTGTIMGTGVVASAIASNGLIDANGGKLKLAGAVTGTGRMQVEAGATLELGSSVNDQQGVTFAGSNGVLLLDTPASYTGVISGFGATETIDLAHTLVTSATLSGTTLTANLMGGGTQTYSLAAALPGVTLKTSSDGAGGTLIQDLYPDNFAIGAITPLGQNTTATSVDFGNQRLGTTIGAAMWVRNVGAAPAESLDATVLSATGAASGVGAVSHLAAGGGDTTDLKGLLDATQVGVQSGTVTFGLLSDGPGSPGGGNGVGLTSVGSTTISLVGTFYREASVSIAAAPSNVIVHVGDLLNEAVSVTNTAAADGWSEKLDVLAINASGAATVTGGISQLAAGATDNTGLSVGLSTANAGMITGSVLLAPESDGAGTSGFTATGLAGVNLAVSAQVDNYAQAAFKAGVGGVLTKTGVNSYTLDVGSVAQGAAPITATFGAGNSALILSDLLAGSFVNSGSSALSVSGLGAFSGLGAGQTDGALKVSLSTANAGSFSDTLTLTHLVGSNASGFSQALGDVTLTIIGKVLSQGQAVINTPQPLDLGAHHVGDVVAPVALSITNSAPANASSLSLDASFGALPFAVTGSGAISMLAPSATDGSSLALGVSTAIAGSISGAATVKFASDNGGVQTPLASQTVAVKGGVYDYAKPILPQTLNLGATRVGKAVNSIVTLANGPFANAYQEALAYAVGPAPAGFSLTGAASGLLAPGKTAPIGVTLSAAASGLISGSVDLSLTSAGVAAAGLAATALPGQSVAVSGKVYAPAAAQLSTTLVNLGAIHVGGSASQTLQVTNVASGALTDNLIGGFAAVTDPNFVFGATGALGPVGLASGAAGTLGFTFASALPGQFNATATLNLASHDADLADAKVSAPTVNLVGKAYALAAPTLNGLTTLNFGAVRTGGAVNGQVISLSDGTAANPFQERLTYSLGALPTGYLLGGGASGTVVAGTPKALTFGVNTWVAGDYSNRTVTLSLTSTGVGTSGLADTPLAPVTITLNGKVYKAATAKLGAGSLAFGVVHVGDQVATKALAITNTATGALTDVLTGGFTTLGGPFTSSSTLGAGLAAGAAGSLGVDLNTAAAGVYTGVATLALASHDADLADAAVAATHVALSATVDNYAVASLAQVGGAGVLTQQGPNYHLDLGTIAQNGGSLSTQFEALNSASGVADLLSGNFVKSGVGAFTTTGLNGFSGLGARKATGPITVSLASTAWGTFTETVTLNATGANASGYKGALAPETLTITGTILAAKQSFTLTTGKDTVAAANNDDTVTAAANTLTSTDTIDGGAGVNTLTLAGGGGFDLRAPTKLTNIQILNAREGQFTPNAATNHQQTVYLRDGLDLTVNVAPDVNPNPGLLVFDSIIIHGAANNDVMNLGSGIDTVYLGSAGESVIGGSGVGSVISTAAFAGALIQGGAHGVSLEITDGGPASLNAADANLTVQLDKATTLTVHGGHGVTIGGDATVKNTVLGSTAALDQLSIQNFATGNETLDLTDLGFGAGVTVGFAANSGGTGGVLNLGDGVHSAAVTLFGQFVAADFHAASDGAGGTMISYVPPGAGGAMAMATPISR
jgi:hypothetical protein